MYWSAPSGNASCIIVNCVALIISKLHAIRESSFNGKNEQQLLDLYFESQEDPYILDHLVKHCEEYPELRHITEEYIERVAKLRLFI
jgi:hypothetical protein